MQPAHAAQVPSINPVLVTGLTARLGAVVGAFAALAVLSHQTVGWNVAAVTGGVWVLALVSVTSARRVLCRRSASACSTPHH